MPEIKEAAAPAAPQKGQSGMVFKAMVLLLLAVIAALLLYRFVFVPPEKDGSMERELSAELGLLPDMTDDEIQDALNRKVAEGMLNVSMNPTPLFPDGSSPGNVRIQNIEGNHYSVAVTIVRSDTEEAILTTKLIDPGYYVEDMKLDQPLPAGEYLCVASFAAYDPETLDYIGETGMQLLITVAR